MGSFGIIDSGDSNEPKETPKVENVGEEFITWAEKYWGFEKTVKTGLENNEGESCSYEYLRGVFVKKINELAENKA